MKNTKQFLLLVLPINFSLSLSAGELEKVPERFQGVWAQDKKNCGKVTESYFEIAESQTKGWEGYGDIKSIYVYQNTTAFISLSSSEGSTWLDTDTFELSSDEQVLFNKQIYPNVKYYKCPEN
ncbi:hypothetical protein KFE80_12880 [bacterium SCSIO 12696]|nr:hypothetical protein KFE80_12880 [bacterium SCSIO 12696]